MTGRSTRRWRDAERDADVRIELPGDGGPMFFRRMPKGRFRMGSRGFYAGEEPAHCIELDAEYCIGSFPVTQRQLASWTSSEAYRQWAEAAKQGDRHRNYREDLDAPAEQVTWFEAVEYCEWLAGACKLPLGWRATLPTEVEWEYACRAGTTTEYSSGDGEAALREVGWFEGNSGKQTHAVGELAANPWGLYDMHGNVWEWCLDRWDRSAYRSRWDGDVYDARRAREQALLEDSRADRVIRGGSWDFSARGCRSAYRRWRRPGGRFRDQGFRVCLLPGPVVQAGRSAEASGERARDGTERQRAGASRSAGGRRKPASQAGAPLRFPTGTSPKELRG